MDERPGQLDQALVEGVVGCRLPARQPEFLQDIMGLVEFLPVEAVEKAQIMGVPNVAGKPGDPLSDPGRLPAHG